VEQRRQAQVRARHETVNARFKCWGVLSQIFWHSLDSHELMFRSVANVVQIDIEEERPVFDVDY
jgi:hypothetical protein